VVETMADPGDGRRTLVRPTRTATRRIGQRAEAPFEPALLDALGLAGPEVVAEVKAALDVLVNRLVPKGTRRGEVV
jgi:hypothetical protein